MKRYHSREHQCLIHFAKADKARVQKLSFDIKMLFDMFFFSTEYILNQAMFAKFKNRIT